VALVDGAPITQQALDEAITLDRIMAELAGQSPSSPAQVLEQLINTELVWQHGALHADEQAAVAALEHLLAASGRTSAELTTALAANAITDASFQHYFARLVAVDAYLRAEQAATGVTVAALIRDWQTTARISFGPAANALEAAPPSLISTAAASPEPPAQPTATAAAPLPATAVSPTATPPALDEPRGTAVGQIAPDFTLPVLADQPAQLSFGDLAGRPTLLSFWTTWCPYCLRQTPVLVDAAARGRDAGIAFVGIDVAERRDPVAAYVAEHAIPYPILLDEAGDVAAAYAVQGYPTTYFLDQDGRIVARHIGALTATQLNTYLEMLQPPEPQPQKVSP
jgi:thiol-disulfide isomerase/thioredoxin